MRKGRGCFRWARQRIALLANETDLQTEVFYEQNGEEDFSHSGSDVNGGYVDDNGNGGYATGEV